MARGRRVRRDEVEELLAAWGRSGERLSDWCRARGLNWYSLNAYKGRRRPAPPALAFAEVVATPVLPAHAVYRVLVGHLAIEVDDGFDDETLVRLVGAVARC